MSQKPFLESGNRLPYHCEGPCQCQAITVKSLFFYNQSRAVQCPSYFVKIPCIVRNSRCGGRCCPCACHYGTLSSISRTHQSFLLFSHAWHWDESHEKRALSSALTGLYKVTVMCVWFSAGSVCGACCCQRWTGGRCLDACGPLLKGPVKSVQCQIALSLMLSLCWI